MSRQFCDDNVAAENSETIGMRAVAMLTVQARRDFRRENGDPDLE